MATHSSILAWRIPMDRGSWQVTIHRATKSKILLKQLNTAHITLIQPWPNQVREHFCLPRKSPPTCEVSFLPPTHGSSTPLV